MTFIDLFAGIGGFRRGMELAGHECVGFCEFNKCAVASYTLMHLVTPEQREGIENIPAPTDKNGNLNFKARQKEILNEEYRNGEWYANDIRAVDARSMPKADCWCFGFPCQDISIAGNCLGFQGHRSSLFFAVTKLIRDVAEEDKPSYLLIENVKNLLSVNRGFDFAKLFIELDEIGYDAEWEVLNSKHFGVPQNRERVFVVGHFRGRSTGKVFPLGETGDIHNTVTADREIHEIAQCLTDGGNGKWQGDYIVKQIGNYMPTATRDNPNQGRIYAPDGISPCLNKMDGGGREPLIPVKMTQNTCKETDAPPTLTASGPSRGRGNGSPVPDVAIPVLTPGRINKRQNGRRFKENGDPAFTLTGQDRHGVFNGARIRKFTPKECFRLQGWTDDYFDRAALINSDSQLYKQAGNGVTVSVVKAIAEKLYVEE